MITSGWVFFRLTAIHKQSRLRHFKACKRKPKQTLTKKINTKRRRFVRLWREL